MNNMNQCGVCCENFSAVIRKEIVCRNAACKYPVCRGCTEHYIIESTQDAHCMSCRNGWDIEFLTSNFSKKFITKDYKTHRENILFDREKSMLPATLPVAEFVQVVHTIKQETKAKLKIVEDDIDDLKMKYKTHHADAPNIPYADLIARTSFDDVSVDIYSRVQANMYIKQKLEERLTNMRNYLRTPQDYMHGGVSNKAVAVTEKRQFIRGCPGADCRGFLSTQWKCGLCHINVCKDCHEIVSTGGTGAEGAAAHVCKDENLKTVALLAKDTRSCPKCAAQIFKIDGCDQMFCTQCHVAFSWKTGKIEIKIHNPHYYQYLRDNGGVVPRNPDDVPCPGAAGNILGVTEICDHVRRAFKNDNRSFTTRTLPNDEDVQILLQYRRMNDHIRYVEINNYVTNDRQDNIDLRIQYLIKEIDESRFKQLLQQREKKAAKKRDIHGIITMYQDVTVDIIGRLAEVQNVKGIKDIIHELNHLRTYTNDCLKPISTRYNCVVPHISDQLTWEKRKY